MTTEPTETTKAAPKPVPGPQNRSQAARLTATRQPATNSTADGSPTTGVVDARPWGPSGHFVKGPDPRRSIARNPAETFKEAWARLVAINEVTGKAQYPLGKLKAMIKDPDTPHPVAGAAVLILQQRTSGHYRGKALCSEAQDRTFDRWIGKPKQQIELETTVVSMSETTTELAAIHEGNPRLVLDVIVEIVERIPGLRLALLERLTPALPAGTGSPPGPAAGGVEDPPPISSLA